MPQTSFPSSAIFGTGPFLVGKSDSGFGLGAEISASTLRSSFSLQETLTSGTNIKTVNGTSLLGSGNVSVTATPAGSSTQIQFNSSSSFAGSSRLTWGETPGFGLVTTDPTAQLLQISPPTGAAYTNNVKYVINGSVTDNTITSLASGVSAYNFVVNHGLNINAGGSLLDTNHPGIGQYFESSYLTNRRGFDEQMLEHHLIGIPSVSTTNWSANNQIRFMSTEVLTGRNAHTGLAEPGMPLTITTYLTAGIFHIAGIGSSFTEPWFALQAGELIIGTGTGTRLTISVDATLAQYSLTGTATHSFAESVAIQGSLDISSGANIAGGLGVPTGLVTIASTAADSLSGQGGAIFVKEVSTRLCFDLYNTTKPALGADRSRVYSKLDGAGFPRIMQLTADDVERKFLTLLETSSAGDPTTTELVYSGDWALHNNTSNGKWFLARNVSGTIKKVELT
jgi:hypothetical protein